jgi:hypothetical protein
MAPGRKLAADFRTRIYLEFLQVLQATGLEAGDFHLKANKVEPPIPPDYVDVVVSVTWLPGKLSCTYWSSQRRDWTADFRRDVKAGRFA